MAEETLENHELDGFPRQDLNPGSPAHKDRVLLM